jgi:hypothetical protein
MMAKSLHTFTTQVLYRMWTKQTIDYVLHSLPVPLVTLGIRIKPLLLDRGFHRLLIRNGNSSSLAG